MTENKNFEWLNEDSRLFLQRGYLGENQTPEERIYEIAKTAEDYLGKEGFANKFYDYMSRGFYSLSSPVWSNYGTDRGLAVSCFNSHCPDNVEGILDTNSELGEMTRMGGGTSVYMGDVRGRGAKIGKNNGESFGSVHFSELFDKTIDTISQGCYDDKTEILTNKGWLFFKDLEYYMSDSDFRVAQVTKEGNTEYVAPLDYMVYDVDEDLVEFKDSKNIDLLVTKNHNMVFKREGRTKTNGKKTRFLNDGVEFSQASECPLHRDIHYMHGGVRESVDGGMTFMERLYVAVSADGNIVKNCNDVVKFHFSKSRKIERIKWILNNLGVQYTISHYEQSNSYGIYANLGHTIPKKLDWVKPENKYQDWCDEFLEEISFWDGSVNPRTNSNMCFSFYSTEKTNANKVQEIAAISGYKSSIKLDNRNDCPNKLPIYTVHVSKGQYFGVERLEKNYVRYTGKVYCVEVPTNMIIVRRNGKHLTCGNSVRRGSIAFYLPIDHPDFYEFVGIGSDGHNIQNSTHGICVSDDFIQRVLDRDEEAMNRWALVLKNRINVGFPYILFTDTANRNTVDVYKDKNMPILSSNLCIEIGLPSNELESFVCVLMSMNIAKYHEFKETDAVEVAIQFLDTVVTDFLTRLDDIRETKPDAFKHMERAYRFAKNHRALGLGVLGLHDLLLSENLPFDSTDAFKYNNEIFKTINTRAWNASRQLAKDYGEPDLLKGYGRRNTTLTAIAPTKSSSFILGQVSQSIEPHLSNYYPRDAAKGRINWKNPFLEKVLESYGKNDRETWKSIKAADGSVQHLDFLSAKEKLVFRTFGEIPPDSIIELASIRQQHVDQMQSLNLRINPKTPTSEINRLYLKAHSMGIKSLYYQKSTNAAQDMTRAAGCSGGVCEA